ncbi:MAG: hemerythrin domain-containing protein [Elusimicrobia bacterium]|nr:hemerythrin domain-containing protein [Elusimicrobiota bacterium]
MNLLDMLRAEHREFLRLLDRLDKSVTKGSPDAPALIGELVSRLERHEEIEEKLLWPSIRHYAPESTPALDVIDADHEGIMRVMAVFKSELFSAGRSPAWLILGCSRLANMVRSHIAREEADLFSIASKRIPAADLERLGLQAESAKEVP